MRGQALARRALEIAAAGRHHLLLVGPPGGGKTMLARRVPGDPAGAHVRRVARIERDPFGGGHAAAGRRPARARPFRAPHHTISDVALAGGGTIPRPGEISLAHNGVLFLDEMPEFDRRALEVLRQPLELGTMTVARAARTAVFPARFMLVGAMNPCPCGLRGHPVRRVPLHAAAGVAVLRPAVGSAPRPDRPDRRRAGACSSGALAADRRRRAVGHVRARVEAARAVQAERHARGAARVNADSTAAGSRAGARSTRPAPACSPPPPNDWRSARAPTTACSRWRARSRTSLPTRTSVGTTSPRPSRYRVDILP